MREWKPDDKFVFIPIAILAAAILGFAVFLGYLNNAS